MNDNLKPNCAQGYRSEHLHGSPASGGNLGRFYFQEIEMKRCRDCGEDKTRSSFYVHSATKDGLRSRCKSCFNAMTLRNYYAKHDCYLEKNKEYRIKNREKQIKYYRERSNLPEKKAKESEYQKKRRALYPDRFKARAVVGNARRRGWINVLPCAKCGDVNVQAHHADYSKPLDIIWLCRLHHREEHGQKIWET